MYHFAHCRRAVPTETEFDVSPEGSYLSQSLQTPHAFVPPVGDVSAYGRPHTHHVEHTDTRPDVVARLEWLDDLMFAAIEGDPVALETAADAWRKTVDDLGRPALEESRQQYLRRAQIVWGTLRLDPHHSRERVLATIEIISLLAGKLR
jgi:hypothetical protein